MKPEDFDIMLEAGVRPAAKLGTVAEILEVDHSAIRKMIRRGDIQAFRLGKRGVRIFLDSIAAYQEGRFIQSQPKIREERQRKRIANTAAQRQAMAELRRLGIIE
jgi:excisionase family DNA binding protein